MKIKGEEPLPALLERLGYSPLQNYSGLETFLHGTFEVEFITHRKGADAPPAVTIPAWQITAQPLPFIDLLFMHTATVAIGDFAIRIPSPEALMLHKLIIAQRRTGSNKEAKKEKDLQQCSALAEIVRVDEIQKIVKGYRLAKKTQKAIETSCSECEISMQDIGL